MYFLVSSTNVYKEAKVNTNKLIGLSSLKSLNQLFKKYHWLCYILVFYFCIKGHNMDENLLLNKNKMEFIFYFLSNMRNLEKFYYLIFFNLLIIIFEFLSPFLGQYLDEQLEIESDKIHFYANYVAYRELQIQYIFYNRDFNIKHEMNLFKNNLLKIFEKQSNLIDLFVKFLVMSLLVVFVFSAKAALIFLGIVLFNLILITLSQFFFTGSQKTTNYNIKWNNISYIRWFVNINKIKLNYSTKNFWLNYLFSRQVINFLYYFIILLLIPQSIKTQKDLNHEITLAVLLFLLLFFHDYHGFFVVPEIIRLKNQIQFSKLQKASYKIKHSTKIEDIFLQNLSFKYDHKNSHNVIDHLSLHLKKNQWIHVQSQTGKGKSTLAKILLMINKPQHGEIFIKYQHNNSVVMGKNLNIYDVIESFSFLNNYLDIEANLEDLFLAENIYVDHHDIITALNDMGLLHDLNNKFQNIFKINLSIQNDLLTHKERLLIFLAAAKCKNSFLILENCFQYLSAEDKEEVLYLIKKYFKGGVILDDNVNLNKMFNKRVLLNVNDSDQI